MPSSHPALPALVALMITALAGPARSDESAAVSATLDRLHAAASRADGRAYFDLFAPDAVFIGTDAGERWGLPAFRAYALERFATGQGWTYVPAERHVTIAPVPCGCIAWFDERLTNAKYGATRGSGVLLRTEGGWKIEQYVLSFPVPNDLADEITGLIRRHEAGPPAGQPSSR